MMLVFLIETSIILLLATVATALMRRSSAASRHVVWTTALLAVLMLPVTSALMPAIPLPVLRPVIAAEDGIQLPASLVTSVPDASASRVFVAAAPPESRAFPNVLRNLPWVPLLWLMGSGVFLFRLARGHHARRRLTARCATCTDTRLLTEVSVLTRRLGIRRRVTTLIAPSEMMPATWGVIRPHLLLPPSAPGWSDEQLALVLTHELAHVLRFDAAAHGVAQAASALVWWNPLVWLASSRAQLEREGACDDLVLRVGISASTYADALISLSRTLPPPFSHRLALAMAGPHRISRRLDAILDPLQRRSGTSHLCAALTSIVLAGQLPLAAAQLASRGPINEPIGGRLSEARVEVSAPHSAAGLSVSNQSPAVKPARNVAAEGLHLLPPTIAAGRQAPQPIPPGQFGAGAYRPGNGVENPVRIREVKPAYTPDAERAGIQGTVELEAVIGPTGTVTDVRILRSLDSTLGLDRNAMDAVRNTPFVPCKIGLSPVSCVVVFELQYTLGAPQPIPDGEFFAGAYRYREGAGFDAPAPILRVHPQYTPEAMRAKIQGRVSVELVVNGDGTVGEAKIYRSLDKVFGLDDQAIKAVRATRWTPGRFNGASVAMVVLMDLTFSLR